MNQLPLRYKISSWTQLPQCMSNNSTRLHLHVADIKDGDIIDAFRITVEHEKYGVLYATLIKESGKILSTDHMELNIRTDEILNDLTEFGFLIEYSSFHAMPSAQIEYIASLRALKFDKLRVMNVWKLNENGSKSSTLHIIGFQSAKHQYWLNNDYSVQASEFTNALVDGSAVNITRIGDKNQFDWSWLDYVANIDDILRDLSEDLKTWPEI